MNDDATLLRRWSDEKSEAAFAELVRRRLDLVYSAALRRLGGDAHGAADVAQTVFATLARDAKMLSRHAVLTAWLYAATRNAAIDLIRSEQRRAARERQGTVMQDLIAATPDLDWERLRPVLDHVMDELGDADRTAVLLRFFEQRSFVEVGAAIGVSEDAARMRVERALEKMRLRLSRRNITSTAGALAVLLANQAVGTAPSGLAATIASAVVPTGIAGTAGAGSIATFGSLILATKGTIALGVFGALSIATTAYQANQARAATARVTATRAECTVLRSHLAEINARMGRQRQNGTDGVREGQVSPAAKRSGAAASRTASATAPAVEAVKAAPRTALQRHLDSDPELTQLRLAQARLRYQAGVGLFLRSIHFTPQQVEQATAEFLQAQSRDQAARAAGLPPPPREARLASFRALFGDVAADRLAEFSQTWAARQLVNEISSNLYFTDEPFTPRQAQQLAEVITRATIPSAPGVGVAPRLAEGLDWNKVITDAEPWLKPVQLQGLRNRAALARIASADPARSPNMNTAQP